VEFKSVFGALKILSRAAEFIGLGLAFVGTCWPGLAKQLEASLDSLEGKALILFRRISRGWEEQDSYQELVHVIEFCGVAAVILFLIVGCLLPWLSPLTSILVGLSVVTILVTAAIVPTVWAIFVIGSFHALAFAAATVRTLNGLGRGNAVNRIGLLVGVIGLVCDLTLDALLD